MSDSQKFPIALHVLAYLAHKGAFGAAIAVCSAELAASIPTNPVVVRRVTAKLARAGLIETRAGAAGGAWLALPPNAIRLDAVLSAVNGCAHLGVPTQGVKGCPASERIPAAVARVIGAAEQAVGERLAAITLADLVAGLDAAAAAA
jgi:DNA-binding IscR family transcriptional regulator